MRLKSHIMIAEKTIDIIETMTDIRFNKRLVKMGAVLPDIHPFRRIQLHTPKIIMNHYHKELNGIINKKKMKNRISLILGLLTHYITDAFTLSHNIYVKDLKSHVQYEYLLQELRNEVIVKFDLIIEEVEKQIESMIHYSNDLSEYVSHRNKFYLENIKNLTWEQNLHFDINQAIIHSSALLINFINDLKAVNIPALAV